MAAKCKRIFVATGQVANAKHADQGFQLVGQRHHQAHQVARQLIARKAGFVVVFNRIGQVAAQTIMARIVAAHNALQLGELTHHVGQQIGLGQARNLLGLLGQSAAAQLLANGLGNGAYPRHALALRTQLIVVHHLAQAFHARLQRLFAVLVEEEFGIGQARAHHTLVAADHKRSVVGRDVAHHQETVRQLARCIDQRKVFLVGLHRENQALLRHVKEFFLKLANQHIGPLHQGGHLIQQGVVFNWLHTAAHLAGRGLELANDLGAALGKTGDHSTIALECFRIFVCMAHHHGV